MALQTKQQKNYPTPQFVDRLLRWFCKKELLESIEGDLFEQYQIDRGARSKFIANIYYLLHVVNFIRPFAIKSKTQNSNRTIMVRHYFSFAWRNLAKHKQDSFLNAVSLSIGIACFIFIFIYVKDELTYDTFHKNAERIYRIPIDFVDNSGTRIPDATTPPALAPALKNEIPEVAEAVRVFPMWGGSYLLGTNDDNRFSEDKILRVDPSFLQVFDFPLVAGNPDSALNTNRSIILTESMVKKYFGDQPAMGQSMTVSGLTDREFIVTGIAKDVPYNSHFTFDFLMPITFSNIDENWGWYNYYTYISLRENTHIEDVEPKLQPMFEGHLELEEGESPNIIYAQALTDIHLKSHLRWELGENGDIKNVYFFGVLGIFILIISFINYLNLTVAKAFKRSNEVGIRKVFGAQKNSIVGQFAVESFLLIAISLIIGTILAEFMFEGLAPLMGKKLSALQPQHIQFYFLLSGVTLFVGLIACLYPAFHLSGYGISNMVKGIDKSGKSVIGIRKSLLIIQFSISAIMIIGTITVYEQLRHVHKSDMGFNKEQVLIIPDNSPSSNLQNFKLLVQQLPAVKSVGLSDGVVGGLNWTFTAGYPDPVLVNYSVIDPEYIETMEFDLIAGRNFSSEIPSDTIDFTIIVNEKALKDFGQDISDIGQPFPFMEENDSLTMGRIIGVLKDFHFTSFKNEIKPYAFFYRRDGHTNMTIKLASTNLYSSIGSIEDTWNEVNPGIPFDYYFLDDSLASLYESEEKLSTILFDLTFLAIFIAFIGMFAITNMVIKDKVKEIAIRKVLGAKINSLIYLIVKNFMVLILIANLIAIPVSYVVMKNWLDGFAYKMDLSLWIFIGSTLLTFMIAFLAVGYQSYKAARSSLVDSLVNE